MLNSIKQLRKTLSTRQCKQQLSACNTNLMTPKQYHNTSISISSTNTNDATSKKNPSSSLMLHKPNPIRAYPSSNQKRVSAKELGNIKAPPYADTGYVAPYSSPHPLIHDQKSIDKLRKAGRFAREILDKTCALAVEGITTDEINDIIHAEILAAGAYPSPLNYSGFPKSICSSVNEVICHGIPDSRPLLKGDIVSFDISCFVDGVHGDNCATVIIGYDTNEEEMQPQKRLVDCAREALHEAIQICAAPEANIRDIGAAVHNVCDFLGYDTVEEYRGHGISEEFHIPPFVKHYRNNDNIPLKPGMIFTIEPMITEGSSECVVWDDQWTVMTTDRGREIGRAHV